MGTCIVCLEDIKSNASKCSHCGAYQNQWRNWLPTIGSVIALLTFVATSVVAIFAFSTDLRERYFWKDDLTIISFQSSDSLVIRNSGDGAVFIDHVSAEYVGPGPIMRRFITAIGKTVAKNSFLSVEKNVEGEDVRFIRSASDDEWALIERLKAPGVSLHFFTEDHVNFKEIYDRTGSDLRTFEAKCKVGFRSLKRENLIRQPFPCVGIFARGK